MLVMHGMEDEESSHLSPERGKLLASPPAEMRIGAYLIAPDAISVGHNQIWLSALDIVNDFESIHRETFGFSGDRIRCYQISTDAHLCWWRRQKFSLVLGLGSRPPPPPWHASPA